MTRQKFTQYIFQENVHDFVEASPLAVELEQLAINHNF